MSNDASATLAALTKALGGEDEVRDAFYRAGDNGKPKFLEVLERDVDLAVRELEGNAQHHQDSSEDLLSSKIVTYLKGRGYDATSNENERGHVDILVKSKKLNLRWGGEAKKHGAYEHALEGIRQLVTRYASGYDNHGGFFLYVFVEGAADVVTDFREKLLGDASCQTISVTDEGDGSIVFRFRSAHSHSCGVPYTVRHHVVLMHHAPRDKSARAAAKRKQAKLDKAAAQVAAESTFSATASDADDDENEEAE